MNNNLSTKELCEFLIKVNLNVINIKIVLYLGMILNIILMAFIYGKYSMILSNNIFIDYALNIFLFIALYLGITSVLSHLYIMKLRDKIISNLESLLIKVNLKQLEEAYNLSIKQDIKDENLLEFLQNY
jgi:hypothetical protein